jgi:tripartite-type tricarboxylate transporter receptor subunit TctC
MVANSHSFFIVQDERPRPMLTRRTVIAAPALAVIGAAPLPTRAQTLKKTLHIIVGFPAGGATDLIARILADRLRGLYAPSVIVENKPGGAARVSVDYIKNAEPDGSEVLFTPDFPLTVYPYSFRNLSYDPLRDLVPVAPVSRSTLTFVIGPAVPDQIKSLPEFVAWCRANPNKAIFATTAAGSTTHFIGVMLANEAGVQMGPVHYRGGAPALQDLFGGHVPASVNPIGETLPLATSGKIRILAVASAQRSKFLPNVPTMREVGYNVVVESWLGAFAPAKTPPDAVRALNVAIGEVVKSREMTESLAKIGNETKFQPPDQFAATVRTDLERWGPVVKASGFVAEE